MAPRIVHTAPLKQDASKEHKKQSGKGFKNPWPSARGDQSLIDYFNVLRDWDRKPLPPPELRHPIGNVDLRRIDDYAERHGGESGADEPPGGRIEEKGMLLTWLGHAAFHLALKCGIHILLDPCCSERCSPVRPMSEF